MASARDGGSWEGHLISYMLVQCKLIQFSMKPFLDMKQIIRDVSYFSQQFSF